MPRKTRAQDGYVFECKTRDILRENGFTVIRSAASQGKIDLLGIGPGKILFIQCKWTSKLPVTSLSVCSLEERKELIKLSRMVKGSIPLLAFPFKPDARSAEEVRFWKITGPEAHNFTPWWISRAGAGLY